MKTIFGIVENPFVVVQGPQGPPGMAGDASVPNNPSNASFVTSGQMPASQGAIAQNGQSASCTFGSDLISFTILLENEREGISCQVSYALTEISAPNDPGNLFLTSDSGVGIYVHKNAASNVLTFKNRTGAANRISILASYYSSITAATPWA